MNGMRKHLEHCKTCKSYGEREKKIVAHGFAAGIGCVTKIIRTKNTLVLSGDERNYPLMATEYKGVRIAIYEVKDDDTN